MASPLLRLLSRGGRVARSALSQTQPLTPPLSRGLSTAPEEDLVKALFLKQQRQFREYLTGLSSVPIPLNPENDKAVEQYADAVKKLREKVGLKSFAEKLADTLDSAEEDSPDVRHFLHDAISIRKQLGVEDSLGVEPLMFAALDTVEKKLGKPLTTSDSQGLVAFQQELAVVNKKLGLKDGDLEKLEGKLDVLFAKAEIAELRAEALEKINMYKRSNHLEDIDVDLKDLKPTAFL